MRWWLAVLLALVALLQYRLFVSEDGLREMWRLGAAVDHQREENEKLGQRNDVLEAEVRDLREGLEAVEEQARTDLGMIQRNESFYQVVELDEDKAPERSERP